MVSKRNNTNWKINFSLSLKLTLTVVILSASIIFSLTYVNISGQAISLENVYSDKAVILSQALDATIGIPDELEDNESNNPLINSSQSISSIEPNSSSTNLNIGLQIDSKFAIEIEN